jgi:EAL domain-containing protein (putative c-di-GMP-specific phosphodiesterase class I)
MQRGDAQLLAGHFLPWIQRLGMSGQLDYRVTQLALALAPQARDRVCINLSAAVLRDAALLQSIEGLLAANTSAAAYLAMEIEEASIYRHLDSFRMFCTVCHRHGIEVGMDRTGRQLSDLGKLHDVGLDYVKLEPALSRDIEHNEGNRSVVGALCTLIHAIGCRVIATDVRDADSQRVLMGLGVDGISGPGVRSTG